MKNLFASFLVLSMLSMGIPAFAASTHGVDGDVSGRSVGAACLSLIVWPGIGQAVNKNTKEKNVTHAVLGLTGVFRLWSFYDALVDRKGGVWKNRI